MSVRTGDVVLHERPRRLAPRLALRGAVVLDGAGTAPVRGAVLLIEGTNIVAVGTRAQIGELGTEWLALDFPEHTILPGLIDCHEHLVLVGDGRPLEACTSESDEVLALRAAQSAAVDLAAGITTVRDCGARARVAFAAREAASVGLFPAPRLLLCGHPITMTGGHCHFFGGECDGPEGVRIAARQLIKDGADFLKIMATGGNTRGTGNHVRGLSVAEMTAAVEEAHRCGKLTTAHASSILGMSNALDAGIDCLEHAVFLDDAGALTFDAALADRIAGAGIFVSATLQEAYRGLAALGEDSTRLTIEERDTLIALRERKHGNIRNAAQLRAAGARLVVSSDAGSRMTPHGDLAFGVELMLQTGMSLPAAIAAATGVAAEAAGIAQTVGTFAPGKMADVLIVNGDVTADVKALARVRAVFQAGALVAERMSSPWIC